MISDLTIIVRLIGAVLLGGAIGFEREHRRKSAGLRTHILVCLGSCLVTILSINLYASVQGFTNADPARLAAQVVSGIGFLGAGAILKEGVTIRGLTTAASLWVVASVGIAIGAGSIIGAVATTVLVVLVLEFLPSAERRYHLSSSTANLAVKTLNRPGQVGRIGSYLGNQGIGIREINIEQMGGDEIEISLIANLPNKEMLGAVVVGLADVEGVISVCKE